MKRKIQIGVMGSSADLKYSSQLEEVALEIGELIAKNNNILIYGAEKDYDSLSTIASRGAKKIGGTTVGITYGLEKNIWNKDSTDIIISTGLERGGGREFVLINSCDVIITIAGGSGTLTEIAMAYQLNIPVIALVGFGGWTDKLANTFIDKRNRLKIISVKNPSEAVNEAIRLVNNKLKNEKI